MNLNILTGFLLCFCLLASISVSQSASANIDSRLRLRRQNEDTDADATANAADNIATTGQPDNATLEAGTIAAADGTTIESADGSTANVVNDVTTAGADGATTAGKADDATTAGAAGEATTAGEADGATTAGKADDATTAGEADGATTAGAAGGATTVAEVVETTGAAGGDTTGSAQDVTSAAPEVSASEGATTGDATTANAAENTEEKSTGDSVTVEESTAGGTGANTDTITSAQPEGSQGTDTTSGDSGVTSADHVSDQTTTVEAATSTVDDNTGSSEHPAETTISPKATDDPDNEITTTVADGGDGGDTPDDTTTEAINPQEPAEPGPVHPGSPGRVEFRVVVNPDTLQVHRGQTVTLNCIVYGGSAATSIYWIQEEPERRYALIDSASDDDKQVTESQISLTSRITLDEPSKIGKYTCMAQDNSGNSATALLTMQETGGYQPQPVYPGPDSQPAQRPSGPGGYLRIVAPEMRDGDYVEIQCEGASPDDEGRIEWHFNGRVINDEQPLYPRGKTLYIRPISRAYLGNYRCSIPGSSYTDASSVLTFDGSVPSPARPTYDPPFTVSVDIVQGQTGQGQSQEGAQIILRCRPSAQAASYQWTFTSNDNQGTVSRGYTDQLVIPQASLSDSGVYTCQASSARGQTASGSANLYINRGVPAPSQPVTGRCSIDEATCRNGRCIPRAYLCDGKNDCGDNSDESCGPPSGTGSDACQPNEIGCSSPGRGRKCVQKFWMCDGDRDCDDGSDEEHRYCELLPRQRHCKTSEFQCSGNTGSHSNPVCIPRSFQCDGYNDCPDRSDEVGCVKPTIISPPQRQIEVNAGSTLTIQCTARGSPAPYINWRLNWGHICRDGSDNGRCQMSQAIDSNDASLITGTLTIRNVNINDGGAYSCEALNNQGFIFAVPDAIVNVITGQQPTPPPYSACRCHGHSETCSPDGRCLNCQHNTAGAACEYCAPGYQGDARRGTPHDCQPIPVVHSSCNSDGTYSERGGRCICKYNVDGERCDQCKRSHFYLNPTTPNGCLPCFCSGVSSDCSSSDWRRKAVAVPLDNWNAVPKNFATDRYEARNNIQQRAGGRELALDQSSLGRPSNEVLYWKAPKDALGDVVTLYDGTIDVHFSNDGDDKAASSNDEFLWLRGNNIDLVHKIPQGQRFQANSNATYSVACNERTFTRKDGTYIDRENILMALSDLDTFLVKVNPIGGRRNAVLRGVTLNLAANDGYAGTALTVEACRCPANYTGTSCERCAEGYGRPHPLVGIYLGQCWSCRSLCNERSDRCDRDTGKCYDCQGNTDGDRCERCRSGYVLDARSSQCVQDGQYPQYPTEPPRPSIDTGSRGVFYIDQRPYDPRSQTPLSIVLDGNKLEQRIPLQLNTQTRSVVWGRTDGSALPANVFQDGNDLVFRNPSSEQGGHYIATITFPDGSVEHVTVYLDHRPGQTQPTGPSHGYVVFNPASPLTLQEGSNQVIQPSGGYNRVQWSRAGGQALPHGVYQSGDGLQITGARPEHSGTYYCELYGAEGSPATVPYEVRVQPIDRRGSNSGAPKVSIQPHTINLKEGQRMIVQYTVASQDPINVAWYKWTDLGYQPIPSLFAVEDNRLVLNRATPDAAGTYQVVVRNSHGEDRQELRINVEPRRGRGRGQQAGAPQIRFQQEQYEVGHESVDIVPNLTGTNGATITWSKDGSTSLPAGVTALNDGTLRVAGRSNDIDGRYNLDVTNANGRSSSSIYIRWRESSGHSTNYGDDRDRARTYVDIRLESRDEQSHQIGRDIHLQCTVQTSAARPYEYTYTKDGRDLENNVEVHPSGLLIVRNAQVSDAGRYRCEVNFPYAPEAGTAESSYDLRLEGSAAGGHNQGHQHGGEDQQHQQSSNEFVEVTVQPSEAVLERGRTANITCLVNGAQQYTVTWGKYAHDISLPDYARQQGNSVILAPTNESPAEEMYLQCQVDVPGRAQPHHAYARVNFRDGNESSKKMKKKRRS